MRISAAGSGGLDLIKRTDLAGSAAFVGFTGLEAGYNYELVMENIAPASDGTNLIMQTSTDNGSTWLAGSNYQYGGAFVSANSAAAATINSAGDSSIKLSAGGIGNAAGERLSGSIMLYNVNNPANPRVEGLINGRNASGIDQFLFVGGTHSTPNVNAVRLLWGSGNFQNVGSVSLFRYAK